MSYLIDRGAIAEGTPLEFRPRTATERAEMREWLNADPRRARAIWTNNRTAPVVWAYDDISYSPTGLTQRIQELSGMGRRAVQGTAYWFLREHGSLAAYAERFQDDEDEFGESPDETT